MCMFHSIERQAAWPDFQQVAPHSGRPSQPAHGRAQPPEGLGELRLAARGARPYPVRQCRSRPGPHGASRPPTSRRPPSSRWPCWSGSSRSRRRRWPRPTTRRPRPGSWPGTPPGRLHRPLVGRALPRDGPRLPGGAPVRALRRDHAHPPPRTPATLPRRRRVHVPARPRPARARLGARDARLVGAASRLSHPAERHAVQLRRVGRLGRRHPVSDPPGGHRASGVRAGSSGCSGSSRASRCGTT